MPPPRAAPPVLLLTALLAPVVAGAAGLVGPSAARAQEVVTQEEALRMAFPDADEVERRTAFLGDSAMARAEELAAPAVEVEEPVVTHYVARQGGTPLGVAYFDSHEVRTLPEVLMVVVTPEGELARVEVLRFDEPREYRPPEKWLEEFRGKDLSSRISTSGSVVNITGATLTSRAVTRAVRRVLALHRVIEPLSADTADAAAGDGDGGGAGHDGRRGGDEAEAARESPGGRR